MKPIEETSHCYNGQDMYRDTRKIIFYTEADFVLYYVDHCIEEER